MTVTELRQALLTLPSFATVRLDDADGEPEIVDVSLEGATVLLEVEDSPITEKKP